MTDEKDALKCKCTSFAKKLTGDGCDICNPALAYEFAKGTIDELETENTALKARVEKLREALEKIAKPALGGKLQQYIAQAALEADGGKG